MNRSKNSCHPGRAFQATRRRQDPGPTSPFALASGWVPAQRDVVRSLSRPSKSLGRDDSHVLGAF